jgi:hypothetical protein
MVALSGTSMDAVILWMMNQGGLDSTALLFLAANVCFLEISQCNNPLCSASGGLRQSPSIMHFALRVQRRLVVFEARSSQS